MRRDRAAAERRAEVRREARAWRREGAIDEAALAAVEAHYPDDRVRVGPVLRVLLFGFALLAINAAFGLALLIGEPDLDGALLGGLALGYAVALAVATEVLAGPLRRAQWGVEAATSLAAIGYLGAGWLWLCFEGPDVLEEYVVGGTLAVLASATAAAAWRWGHSWYGAAAAALGLALLARAPYGRWLWVAAAVALCPLLFRWADSPRLAPGHRDALLLAAVVGIVALYVAVNVGSLDDGLVEALGGHRATGEPPAAALRGLAVAATAGMPVGLLAWGAFSRRRSLLVCGVLAAAQSLVTWWDLADLAPAWLFLTLLGAAAVAGALAARRLLESSPGGERGGFTTAPLFADLQQEQALEAGAAALTLTPEAAPAREERFTGGGGEFGGGGSSSDF